MFMGLDVRLQGIGSHLVDAAIQHLKSLQCTRVVLHALPSGQSVYECMGFVPNNEMKLDLM